MGVELGVELGVEGLAKGGGGLGGMHCEHTGRCVIGPLHEWVWKVGAGLVLASCAIAAGPVTGSRYHR